MAEGFKIITESSSVNELLEQMRRDLADDSPAAREMMKGIGFKLENEERRQITRMGAVGRSGLLRENIRTESPAPWYTTVTAYEFYSVYVARGTGEKGIASATGYGWPTSWYTPEWIPGMTARPFDLKAIEAKEDDIIYYITQFSRKVVSGRA